MERGTVLVDPLNSDPRRRVMEAVAGEWRPLDPGHLVPLSPTPEREARVEECVADGLSREQAEFAVYVLDDPGQVGRLVD
jgi:hypothetical protein